MHRHDLEFGLSVTTPPAVEPVTLAEAKLHLKQVSTDADDALITRCIAAARANCEARTHRAFVETEFLYVLNRFPRGPIILPRPTLMTLATVKYIDAGGTEQTLYDAGDGEGGTPVGTSDYFPIATREPAIVRPATGLAWPVTYVREDAVRVAYTAGFGDSAADVPDDIKAAVLLMAAHLYEQREPVAEGQLSLVPMSVDSLLGPYVCHWTGP